MVAKSNLKVQNIVATTSLGKPVSLTKLARSQSNTEYNPEQFPGLVLRIKKPKSAVLVFSSGNLVCTGTKSVAQVKEVINQVINHKVHALAHTGATSLQRFGSFRNLVSVIRRAGGKIPEEHVHRMVGEYLTNVHDFYSPTVEAIRYGVDEVNELYHELGLKPTPEVTAAKITGFVRELGERIRRTERKYDKR